MAINYELYQLYLDDKSDRAKFDDEVIDLEQLLDNDKKRLNTFYKIQNDIDESEIWNCHYACLVLMHSPDTDSKNYELAHSYAKKALEMGSNVTKWLYAASLDRWLVSQGKLQKFGTQYNTTTGKILDYDTKTTDEERAKYGVPPLEKLLIRN